MLENRFFYEYDKMKPKPETAGIKYNDRL